MNNYQTSQRSQKFDIVYRNYAIQIKHRAEEQCYAIFYKFEREREREDMFLERILQTFLTFKLLYDELGRYCNIAAFY